MAATPAWTVSPVVCAIRTSAFFATPRTVRSNALRHATSSRHRATVVMQSMPPTENLPLVSVPADTDLPTPGEHRHLTLDYSLLTSILQSQTTAFGLLPLSATSSSLAPSAATAPAAAAAELLYPVGSLLNILRIDAVSPQSLSATVQVHCAARLAVHAVHDAADADGNGLSRAQRANALHDSTISTFEERASLADAEWRLWEAVREASIMHRRLHRNRRLGLNGGPGYDAGIKGEEEKRSSTSKGGNMDDVFAKDEDGPPSLAHKVFVWAPREYDREMGEEDWEVTPDENRTVWMRRAESFSFAVVRAFSVSDVELIRARNMTSTRERVALGLNCVQATVAKLSVEMCVDEVLRKGID